MCSLLPLPGRERETKAAAPALSRKKTYLRKERVRGKTGLNLQEPLKVHEGMH